MPNYMKMKSEIQNKTFFKISYCSLESYILQQSGNLGNDLQTEVALEAGGQSRVHKPAT